MRTLPEGLQQHLDSGMTTLCLCWRIRLVSGEEMGFTDHDLPLEFDGTQFESSSGFTASDVQSTLGFAVDDLEASGALRSDRLDATRLAAGDFDHAEIELWRVNWRDVAMRVLLRRGHLGEVTTEDGAFRAEVRGLAHLLGQPVGRLFQHGCDAQLGDARCGVDLDLRGLRHSAEVVEAHGAQLLLAGATLASGDANRGSLRFQSGQNQARVYTVIRHMLEGTLTRVTLSATPPLPVLPGDTVVLTAGCDGQFETCRRRFANAANFRGFPHMPGTDFLASGASADAVSNRSSTEA